MLVRPDPRCTQFITFKFLFFFLIVLQLEHLLETHFEAPSGKEHGLHDKITAARHNGQPLPEGLQRQMRKLVTIRNRLVHEREFNEIPERPEFVKGYDQVR